ncbi:MAG: ABC transporter ATP-binding protein [bacterium]|nr:ABC transporter ATP-binding protein [bacterium]
MNTVSVKNLTKFYNKQKALDDISFDINTGEIFGIVGPDGAGKTTLLRILTGILEKTSGKISIMNFDIDKDCEKIKYHTGYMSQKFNLYPTLTVEENIKFFAGIFGVSQQEYNDRGEYLLNLTGLANFKTRQAKDLSGGMKQKLALISTLIHKPDVLILDEPTLGVDPVSRRDFWQILQEFSQKGTSIIVSTSYMDEAELCNKIILLFEGRIIIQGNPVEVKKIDSIVLELSSIVGTQHAVSLENIIETIKPFVVDLSFKGEKIRVILKKDGKEAFTKEFGKLFHINEISPSIEDVFMRAMQK